MRLMLQIMLPILIIGGGVTCSVWLVVNKKQTKTRAHEQFRPRVRVVTVKIGAYRPVIRSQGTVAPQMSIVLSAEVTGRVKSMAPALVAGGLFAKGEELLRIDSNDYKLALRQARARIDASRAGITNALAQMSSAQSQMAQAESRISREEAEATAALSEWRLLGRKGNPPALLVREPQLKEARAALDSAKALLVSTDARKISDEAELLAAQAAADLAATNVLRCVIRAPFDGRVATRTVGVGQVVSQSTVLAQLQTVDVAEVRLALPLTEFGYLDLGDPFRGGSNVRKGPSVRLLASHGAEWSGRVVRSLGEVDEGTRMMSVVAQVRDPYWRAASTGDAVLSFGMFVTAQIVGRELRAVAVLPRGVLREGVTVHVFREGKLWARKVQVAWSTREVVVINDGLKAGDKVCLTPVDAFVEGMKVLGEKEAGGE